MKPLIPFCLILLLSASCVPKRWLVQFSDPLTSEEHVQLARTYQVQGLGDKAYEHLKKAVEKDENNAQAWVALGDIEFGQDNMKEAQKAYEKALAAEPENARALNNLANVYLAMEELDKAEELALKAYGAGDDYKPYALDTLAQVYIKTSRYDEAAKALDEAEERAPESDPSFPEKLEDTKNKLEAGRWPNIGEADQK